MTQRVFVTIRPTAPIREWNAEIHVCKMMTWAELPSGRRCLLGTTAFFTRKSAEVRKLGMLRKVVATTALRFLHPTLYDNAVRQLNEHMYTGRLQ